jgi:iron-sulfur cluster assembly protein
MALDEPKVNDEVIKNSEITYLIEKELYDKAKPINIDFTDSAMGSGFSITSNMSKGDSCGSCSCS